MSSTRNNNTPGNYCLQQRAYAESLQYASYKGYGKSDNTGLPCLGTNVSYMPSSILSGNAVDIESSLRGTGANNLVNPQAPVKPELNNLKGVAFFKQDPTIMPKPLVIEGNQRPFPI